ncbi:General transcriptional corepressor [Phytophthora cactorum]|nr:General transcriptional corepressor [Phytophthora cactorum]
MPSINSEVNGKDRASSPPALKKSKLNGSEPSIPSLNGNGKGALPSVSSAGNSAPTSSGMLPQVSKMNREQGSASTNSSPSAASIQQNAASNNTKTEGENAETSRPSTSATTTLSAASGNNTTQKSSNTKASRLNWSCVYSSKTSMSYQESERPAAEMHQSMDHQSVVCCVRFSSDGTMMASGCHKTAQVFDVKTGDRKFLVSRPAGSGQTPTSQANAAANEPDDAYVRAVCFSPDCTKLVAGMPQNTIRVWDIASNEEGPAMTGHESEIYSLDYVNDLIVSGSGDRKVRLWDARNGQCKKIFGNESGGPSDGVTSVALSPDGRLLAAASLDKVVRIWDTETAQLLDRLEGHSDSVYSIAFSPDGKNVISGSLDRNIMLWDVCAQGRTTTRPRMLFQGHKDFVLSVAYTPDGRWLMSGSKDRSVVFWDPRSSRSVLTLTGYRNSVISVASSPASPYFATGSGDCFAVIWKYQCQTF